MFRSPRPIFRLVATPPTWDKGSESGNALFTDWQNSSDGDSGPGSFTDTTYQPCLVDDPDGSGRRCYALTTRDTAAYTAGGSSFQRVDFAEWTSFQHLGVRPNWQASPFRDGQDWWFSWEIRYPSADVINDSAINLGHYRPMAGQFNFYWQLHQDDFIQGGTPSYSQVPVVSEVIADAAAANPKLAMRFIGGNLDNATSGGAGANANLVGGGGAFTRYEAPSNSLLYDHWYRYVMHLYISNDDDGFAQVWLDGVPIIDMLAVTPVSWTKLMLNASNNLITQVSEATQPTNMYRVSSVDSQGFTDSSGTMYPGVMNYHDFFITSGVENTNNVVTLHRTWEAGKSLASVGGF
jgi:hypothetical protein